MLCEKLKTKKSKNIKKYLLKSRSKMKNGINKLKRKDRVVPHAEICSPNI